MAVTTFGVVADDIRLLYFPHSNPFSTNTSPSAVTVGRIITRQAAVLEGRLYRQGVTASAIEEDTPAYEQCAGQLCLMVAITCARAMKQTEADVVKAWKAESDAWMEMLQSEGATFLGNQGLEHGTPPTGPVTHITALGLELPDVADASSLTPMFRKDDPL